MNNTLQQAPPQVVFGTAGHVDHGKSTLVSKLTGTDPDRLAEEKRRGLSIELGFAFLPGDAYAEHCDLGFVDCPGHARFLRHTIAGMGAMQGCLLVIAADEGIAAQTREHFDLLRLLRIPWGRVIITKAGLADAVTIDELRAAIASFVSGTVFAAAEPLVTDAMTGAGLDELRACLFEQARASLARATEGGFPRLAVDRVFTIAGHGTVVTGTLLGGSLHVGDELACYPGPSGRVRGLQVRSLPVQTALAGQRTAINLAGVDHKDVQRGCWLAPPRHLTGSTNLDVLVRPIGPGLKHGQAIRCFHGAAAIAGRIILVDADETQGGQAIAQLRLEQDLFVGLGDDVVIRQPSPAETLGVASVLAVDAPRHKRFRAATRRWFADLQGAPAQRLCSWLEQLAVAPATRAEAERFCSRPDALQTALEGAGVGVIERRVSKTSVYWGAQAWDRLARQIAETLQTHAARSQGATDPWYPLDRLREELSPSCSAAAWEDRLAAWQHQPDARYGPLLRRDRLLCLPQSLPALSDSLHAEVQALLDHYAEHSASVAYDHPVCDARPDPELARRALAVADARGWLIALSDRQHWHRGLVEALVADLRQAFAEGTTVDLQWAKRRYGLSRRGVMPFLDWCDRVGLSARQGNERRPGGRLANADLPIPLLAALPVQGKVALPTAAGEES